MKLLVPLFTLLLVSCGKNAFLKSAQELIRQDVVVGDGDTNGDANVRYTIDLAEYDFGNIGTSQTSEYTFNLTRVGDGEVTNPVLIIDQGNLDDFSIVDENCAIPTQARSSSSTSNRTCQFKVIVRDGVNLGALLANISIGYNDIEQELTTVRATRIQETTPGTGSPRFGRLDGQVVDFNRVNIQNSYQQLLLVNVRGDADVEIISIGSTDQVEVSGIGRSNMCSGVISNRCYLNITLNPVNLGENSYELPVVYKDLGSGEIKQATIIAKYFGEAAQERCRAFSEKRSILKDEANLSSYEKSLETPYYLSRAGSSASLEPLYGTAYNKTAQVLGKTVKYNEDTQVTLSFDLPTLESSSPEKEKILNAKLYSKFKKFEDHVDIYKSTELICSLDKKTCSGEYFLDGEYSKLINRSFRKINNYFSKELTTRSRQRGGYHFYYLKKGLSLSKYLGFTRQDYKRLYEKNSTISFAVADDVRLDRKPEVIFKTRKFIDCNSSN